MFYQLVKCTMGQVVKRRDLIPETRSRQQANTYRNYDEKSVTELFSLQVFCKLIIFSLRKSILNL